MKIIIYNNLNKIKFNFKTIIIIFTFGILIISGYLLNSPTIKLQENEHWQVKVYQKADYMMAATTPWVMRNDLQINLTRQNSGESVWCLRVTDINKNELFPGIRSLLINYSEALEIIDGYALNDTNEKVMSIQDFFNLSLYGPEFFTLQTKKYQTLGLLFKDKVKVELSEEKGRSIWCNKNQSWWSNYESNCPPIKAQLAQY